MSAVDIVDVLIVGAGPTGLTMAIECLRYNLSCKIIDQSLNPSPYSKAIAIQARTLEVFQRMGIHHRFLAAGLQIRKANIHSNHHKHAHLDLKHIPSHSSAQHHFSARVWQAVFGRTLFKTSNSLWSDRTPRQCYNPWQALFHTYWNARGVWRFCRWYAENISRNPCSPLEWWRNDENDQCAFARGSDQT